MSIEQKELEIIEEFSMFDNWEDKYQYLIDLGKNLKPLDSKFKTEEKIIKGCQSQVWLHSELKDGKMIYTADSDAIITKGMVALMISVLSDEEPVDIVKTKLEFIDRIGLKEHLSPTRANGMLSMINRMKQEALYYINKEKV